jgi:hypothetical protein
MGCSIISNAKNCPYLRVHPKCIGCPFELKEMVEAGPTTWWETHQKETPVTTSTKPSVDARSYQHPITVCLHGGREHNNEETHRCEHYIQSVARPNQCMYWCKNNARCDCVEK